MNFSARDVEKLRWHLAAAAGLVVLGGAIAYFSLITAQKAQASHQAAAARHAQIDNRLRQVRTEEEEIKKRTALFFQLQAKGILGDERRLDWTEMLLEAQRNLRLPGMNYEFSPAKAMDAGSDENLYVSKMTLHLQLLHEEDLLDFLGRMQHEAKAMVLVRSCNIARLPTGSASLAQLSADCEVDWITARIKGGIRNP